MYKIKLTTQDRTGAIEVQELTANNEFELTKLLQDAIKHPHFLDVTTKKEAEVKNPVYELGRTVEKYGSMRGGGIGGYTAKAIVFDGNEIGYLHDKHNPEKVVDYLNLLQRDRDIERVEKG